MDSGELKHCIDEAKNIEKEQKLNKVPTNDSLKEKCIKLVGKEGFDEMIGLVCNLRKKSVGKNKQIEVMKNYCGSNKNKMSCAFYIEQMLYDSECI